MAEDVDPSKLEIADELIAERRSAAPGQLPDDMNPMHRKIIGFIDTLNDYVGKTVCWFIVPLCLAMVYEVIVRKFGTSPTGWYEELVRVLTNPDAPSQLQPAPTSMGLRYKPHALRGLVHARRRLCLIERCAYQGRLYLP